MIESSEIRVRGLISRNLKRIRTSQNKSQLALAQEADLTHNFINDIENCKKGISIKSIATLSVVLGVEPYQFFLPEDSGDGTRIYIDDFNTLLQKLVKELSSQYLPPEKQE